MAVRTMANKGPSQMPLQSPVIVNSSLKDSEITKLLQQRRLKVRFSESTQEHSCIFPKSSCAFLILPLAGVGVWNPSRGAIDGGVKTAATVNEEVLKLLDKFQHIHRRCYVLCVAAIHGEAEMEIFSQLQQRFLFSNLKLLPAHNAMECINGMLTIVKGLMEPNDQLESLAKTYVNGMFFNALSVIGLTEHDKYVLEQGLGSLCAVAIADRDELLDCSLDHETADKILNFFKK